MCRKIALDIFLCKILKYIYQIFVPSIYFSSCNIPLQRNMNIMLELNPWFIFSWGIFCICIHNTRDCQQITEPQTLFMQKHTAILFHPCQKRHNIKELRHLHGRQLSPNVYLSLWQIGSTLNGKILLLYKIGSKYFFYSTPLF